MEQLLKKSKCFILPSESYEAVIIPTLQMSQ